MLFNDKSVLNKYDNIVIGAGISGLTIALILAKEGKKVALFERDEDIAPLIRPYKRKNCECSPGLHISGWMGDGQTISSFLKYLNVADGAEKQLSRYGYGDIIIGDKNFHIPCGFENVEKALQGYFPEDADAIHNYMRLVFEVNDQSFYFNHTLLPGKTGNNSGFIDTANYTLAGCLKGYKASEGLIEMLGILSFILIGSKAEEVPFIIHAFVLGGFYKSPGFFTINGINKMLSNFKRELKKHGADIFLNTEITGIMTDDERKATGVKTLSGEEYLSPSVTVTFNPKLLKDTVGQGAFRPVFRRRLEEAENTVGLYVAFYKIERGEENAFENFVCYDKDLDVTVGTTKNHSGHNNEQLIVSVFMPVEDAPAPADQDAKNSLANEKLKLMENVLYKRVPGLRGKAELLDYLKPWSFERYTKTVNGSAYGIKQTLNSIGFQHKVPVRGLYLAGQAIYPGFLGAMISAFGLAFILCENDEFWSKVINR